MSLRIHLSGALSGSFSSASESLLVVSPDDTVGGLHAKVKKSLVSRQDGVAPVVTLMLQDL